MSESLSEKPSPLETEFDEHTLRREFSWPETVNTASKSFQKASNAALCSWCVAHKLG